MEGNAKKITTKPVTGLNAKTVSFSSNIQKDVDFEELEATILEKELKLEAEKIQLENFKRQSEETKRKEKLAAVDTALENAKRYDDWAKSEVGKVNADRELAEQYLQMARESQAEARVLQSELGLDSVAMDSAQTTDDETGLQRLLSHKIGWAVSVLASIITIGLSYYFMMEYKRDIDHLNSTITDPSQKIGSPYDESSIQGIIYDNLVQFTDIPKLWLFLLILCSPIFFYCLPFVKTKVSPWLDWQQVSPSTRLWLLFAFSALVFLASSLYHLAGSGR